jgi:hypothetical protein
MSQKKGNFVIRNSEGRVKLAGIATNLTNDVMSIEFGDLTEVVEYRDAGNVPRTLTRDHAAYEQTLRLTPGIGYAHTTQQDVKDLIASLERGDTIDLRNFEDAQFNWTDGNDDAGAPDVGVTDFKAFIWQVGKVLSQGELLSVTITARRVASLSVVLSVVTETPIDYSAAWANL